MTGDRFAEWDAAYVLGSLTPADRRAFEAHLPGCADCSGAVAGLAAMPGLLSHAPAAAVLDSTSAPEPPPELLPRLLSAARRERRRRRLWAGAGAGVAAAAVLLGALVGVQQAGWSPEAGSQVAMTAVRDVPVKASLRVQSVTWGTRLHLHCRYDGRAPAGGRYEPPVYQLVVVPADGSSPRHVAQWSVVPGLEAAIDGSTDLPASDIAEVRLQTLDGTVLMRAFPAA